MASHQRAGFQLVRREKCTGLIRQRRCSSTSAATFASPLQISSGSPRTRSSHRRRSLLNPTSPILALAGLGEADVGDSKPEDGAVEVGEGKRRRQRGVRGSEAGRTAGGPVTGGRDGLFCIAADEGDDRDDCHACCDRKGDGACVYGKGEPVAGGGNCACEGKGKAMVRTEPRKGRSRVAPGTGSGLIADQCYEDQSLAYTTVAVTTHQLAMLWHAVSTIPPCVPPACACLK